MDTAMRASTNQRKKARFHRIVRQKTDKKQDAAQSDQRQCETALGVFSSQAVYRYAYFLKLDRRRLPHFDKEDL